MRTSALLHVIGASFLLLTSAAAHADYESDLQRLRNALQSARISDSELSQYENI